MGSTTEVEDSSGNRGSEVAAGLCCDFLAFTASFEGFASGPDRVGGYEGGNSALDNAIILSGVCMYVVIAVVMTFEFEVEVRYSV